MEWMKRVARLLRAQRPEEKQPEGSLQLPPKLPVHVAIIMDGNGRWARRRNLPRAAGHQAGTEALRDIIRFSSDIGIQYLTIYAFSTENWSRSEEEVSAVMALLLRYFASEIDELCQEQVRIRILGDVNGLPAPQREAVCNAMERSKDNTGLTLSIALNYGGRQEILHAAKQLARRAAAGEDIERFTMADLQAGLYTFDMPDVDLVIRTSGEERLSNFLPWQTVYSELVFDPVLWPDFTKERYLEDLRIYASRDRRFGGRKISPVKKQNV